MAFGAFAHQQQIVDLDGATEIGDRRFVTAPCAPHVGQQPVADVGWDGLPALARRRGEVRKRFNFHGSFLEQVGVCPGTHEDDGVAFEPVDQQEAPAYIQGTEKQ